MKRARTETDKVHASVAYSGDAKDILRDVLRDSLSPHAIAAIVACLKITRTANNEVDREVEWFADILTDLVGGHDQQERLAEELGI